MKKIKKHISLTAENVKEVEELCEKSSVSQSNIIDKILTEFFSSNKKTLNIGISI